jgi:hypothetical protein
LFTITTGIEGSTSHDITFAIFLRRSFAFTESKPVVIAVAVENAREGRSETQEISCRFDRNRSCFWKSARIRRFCPTTMMSPGFDFVS